MEDSLSDRQKKFFIKRYIDNEVIDIDTLRAIYIITRSNHGLTPIRDSKNIPGIFLDLDKVNQNTIDRIYCIVKKHLKTITIN